MSDRLSTRKRKRRVGPQSADRRARRRMIVETLESRRLLAADPTAFGYNAIPTSGEHPLATIEVEFSDTPFDPVQTPDYYRRVLHGDDPSVRGYFNEQSNDTFQFVPASDGDDGVLEEGSLRVTYPDDVLTPDIDESRFEELYASFSGVAEPPILYANILWAGELFVKAPNGGGGTLGLDEEFYEGDGEHEDFGSPREGTFKIIDLNGGELMSGDEVKIRNSDLTYWRVDGDQVDAEAVGYVAGTTFRVRSPDGGDGVLESDPGSSVVPLRFEAPDGRFIDPYINFFSQYRLGLSNLATIATEFQLQPAEITLHEKMQTVISEASEAGLDWDVFDDDSSGGVRISDEVQVLIIESAGGATDGGAVRFLKDFETVNTNRLSGFIAYSQSRSSFETHAHELAHLFGTDDIYGSACHSSGVTLMSCTAVGRRDRVEGDNEDFLPSEDYEAQLYHLDPWHKMRLGWVEPDVLDLQEIVVTGNYDFDGKPVIVYDSARGTNEYFMFEQRPIVQVDGTYETYDANVTNSATPQPGIAVWYVKLNDDGSKNNIQITSLFDPEKTDGSVFLLGHDGDFTGDPNDRQSRGSHGVSAAERLWKEGDYRLNWLRPAGEPDTSLTDVGSLFTIDQTVDGNWNLAIKTNSDPDIDTAGGSPLTRILGTDGDDTWHVSSNEGRTEIRALDDLYFATLDAGRAVFPRPIFTFDPSDFDRDPFVFQGLGGNDRLIIAERRLELDPLVIADMGDFRFEGGVGEDTLEVRSVGGAAQYAFESNVFARSESEADTFRFQDTETVEIFGVDNLGFVATQRIELTATAASIDADVQVRFASGVKRLVAETFPQGITVITGSGRTWAQGTEFDDTFILNGRDPKYAYGLGGDDTYVMPDGGNETTTFRKYFVIVEDTSGSDTISFAESTLPIMLDLGDRENQELIDPSLSDALASILIRSDIEHVIGSPFDDQIVGTVNSEWIEGRGGLDHIDGRGGDDVIVEGRIFEVTNSDDGSFVANSLRSQIAFANLFEQPDAIVFDEDVWDSTITLRGDEIEIADSLQIIGPPMLAGAAPRLVVDGNDASRAFNINRNGSSDPNFEVSIKNLNVHGGSTTGDGGAIISNANTVLKDLVISNSFAEGNGGGVFVQGSASLTLDDVTVRNNAARGFGGGLGVQLDADGANEVLVRDSLFRSNRTLASGSGAGIYLDSDTPLPVGGMATVRIERTIVEDNLSDADGGGIAAFAPGNLIIRDSTLASNSAVGNGGGLRQTRGGDGFLTAVVGSTISGNVSGNSGGGASFASSSVSFSGTTITGNIADWDAVDPTAVNANGGGLDIGFDATVQLNNTIVAANFDTLPTEINANDISGVVNASASRANLIGDPNSAGTLVHSVDGNLVGDGAFGLVDIDDVLDRTLAFNGGPTPTHALVSGSLARNAGESAGVNVTLPTGETIEPQYDQRGAPFRRQSSGFTVATGLPDIGAFESQSVFVVDTPEDDLRDDIITASGSTSLRRAMEAANANPGRDTVIFDTSLRDRPIELGLGEIVISDGVDIQGPSAADYGIIAGVDSRIFSIDLDDGEDRVEISGLSLSGGRAPDENGGAIWTENDLRLVGVELVDNLAKDGGAVFLGGDADLGILNSLLDANTASVSGGAIAAPVGNVSISNSTLSNNSAGELGGAVFAVDSATLQVRSSTLALNQAGTGGGGIFGNEFLEAHNSIFAANGSGESSSDNVKGVFSSKSSHNLFDGSAKDLNGGIEPFANDNIAGTKEGDTFPIGSILDPVLIAAGGSTRSLMLALGSPAIDAGDVNEALDDIGKALDQDQRGGQFNRVAGSAMDIGSAEFSSGPTSLLAGGLRYQTSAYDDSTDATKRPLVAGEMATFANYTGFVDGITSVVVDVLNPNSDLSQADFLFRTGTSVNPNGWADASEPKTFSVAKQQGAGGADRVTITWDAEKAVKNAWLQIVILANKNTGFDSPKAHYWGNQIGETGNDPNSTAVNASDVGMIVNHPTGFQVAEPGNPFDLNKDGRVNASDVGVIVNNPTGFTSLPLFVPPTQISVPPPAAPLAPVAVLSATQPQDRAEEIRAERRTRLMRRIELRVVRLEKRIQRFNDRLASNERNVQRERYERVIQRSLATIDRLSARLHQLSASMDDASTTNAS